MNKPVTNGNDNLYALIEKAADILVDLIREAEARGGQEVLVDQANEAYGAVLALSPLVKVEGAKPSPDLAINVLFHAHEHGRNWAEGLRPGDAFPGASAAASAAGYTEGARRIFIAAAMDVLEGRVVVVNDNGILKSIDRKSYAPVERRRR